MMFKKIRHLNIADATLRRIKKYCSKETKEITEKEKKIHNNF